MIRRQEGEGSEGKASGGEGGGTSPWAHLPAAAAALPCYPSMLPFTHHVESCLLLDQLFPVDPRRGGSTVDTHMTMLSSPT